MYVCKNHGVAVHNSLVFPWVWRRQLVVMPWRGRGRGRGHGRGRGMAVTVTVAVGVPVARARPRPRSRAVPWGKLLISTPALSCVTDMHYGIVCYLVLWK